MEAIFLQKSKIRPDEPAHSQVTGGSFDCQNSRKLVENAKRLRNQSYKQIFDDREIKECKISQKIAVEPVENPLHPQNKKDVIEVQLPCEKSTKNQTKYTDMKRIIFTNN
jgi:hypothetical protein